MKDFEPYQSPVSDSLGIDKIIFGLAEDLQSLRSGKISVQDGLARAAIAKQVFNGLRLYFQAMQTMTIQRPDVTGALPTPGDAA